MGNSKALSELPALDGKGIAIVRRALLLSPGLSSAARSVGGYLTEHYNRTSGRCDPGIDRLARIMGLTDRTIKNALTELDGAKIFAREIHGGRSGTNFYRPLLGTCRGIIADVEARLKTGQAPAVTAKEARRAKQKGGKNLPAKQEENFLQSGEDSFTQTHRKNPSERTLRFEGMERGETVATSSDHPSPSAQVSPSRQGLGKTGDRRDVQSLIRQAAIRNNVDTNRATIARTKAETRIYAHFQRIGGATFNAFCNTMEPGKDPYEKAVSAELAKRGMGIPIMERALVETGR